MTEDFEKMAGAFPNIATHRGADDTWERLRERFHSWDGKRGYANELFLDMLARIKVCYVQIQVLEEKRSASPDASSWRGSEITGFVRNAPDPPPGSVPVPTPDSHPVNRGTCRTCGTAPIRVEADPKDYHYCPKCLFEDTERLRRALRNIYRLLVELDDNQSDGDYRYGVAGDIIEEEAVAILAGKPLPEDWK